MGNTTEHMTTAGTAPHENDFTRVVAILIPVIFALITALGFIGNILVILVILCNKAMKEGATYWLILNLAVADLFFLIICVPFTAVKYATDLWVFGDTWCRLVNYMTYVCAWASAYTLVLMCLDRLLAVVFALQLPHVRSRRNIGIAVSITWVMVFLVNIPAWMFHGLVTYEVEGIVKKSCGFLYGKVEISSRQTFQTSYFVFGFALPVLVMTILYSILIMFLAKQNISGNNRKTATQKATKRVTIIVVSVVSLFVICWLPIHIILMMANNDVYPEDTDHIALLFAANCLAYMNSCLNPILYTISSTAFRKEFKRFLCFGKLCPLHESKKAKEKKRETNLTNIATQAVDISNSNTPSDVENKSSHNGNGTPQEKSAFLKNDDP